ncbi:MAG: aspartate aminotransferase family protein [Chloroflexi bacterium]|nr:aspartate aminotransferase family protein [Chloroflexota bacterium]
MPNPNVDWKALEARYYMQVRQREPVVLVRGKGVRVWDDQGREFLDFVGGWAVNSLGHCHPVMVEALHQQAHRLIQVSNQFYSAPQVQLAELLVKNSCLHRVFFGNSGAEANEGAVKLARRYGKLKLGGAYEVITALNSFHGRTITMATATGQTKYSEPFAPLTPGFVYVPYDDIEAIKKATNERTCAVMLEPVQGEGGVNIPHPNYLKEVRQWCDQKGILLILDEIQTGLGRVGALFGYQCYGVEPDIMTLAKGLGGGVPIGAFLAREHCSVFQAGDHGTTYGGNPLMCAVAYAVVKYVIEEDVPGNAQRVGKHLLTRLLVLKDRYPMVKGARGMGLLAALEFKEDIAQQVLMACLEKGLLVNRIKPNLLRFMPPLITTEQDVDEAVEILGEVLSSGSYLNVG